MACFTAGMVPFGDELATRDSPLAVAFLTPVQVTVPGKPENLVTCLRSLVDDLGGLNVTFDPCRISVEVEQDLERDVLHHLHFA